MSMIQKRKKSPVKRIAMVCSAVFVGILFLMAGSCPGGGTGGSAEGSVMLILEGAPPGTNWILPQIGFFDFGNKDGSGDTQTFTIASVGDEVLNLTGSPLVQITGGSGKFNVSQQPPLDAIDPGTTTDFIIEFVSAGGPDGPYNAIVTVQSNDPDLPSYAFDLIGTLDSNAS